MLSLGKILYAMFIGLLIGTIGLFGYYVFANLNGMPYVDCSKNSVVDAVECLNANFSSFYIFNQSNSGKRLSFKEFKSQGGVCIHSAIWYGKQLRKLGYEISPVLVNTRNEISHAFIIVSSSEAYCIVDQNMYQCWEFGE